MADENSNSNYYISSLLRKLQSSSSSSVQKALISLSRATRKSDNVVKLREEGGIELLLTFIQSSNKKALDMAVSVLANCALEKQSRTEIKQLKGVVFLCNLLASLAETSILSRVTRALANLSQDVTISNEILNHDTVSKLLAILRESTDVPLLQNTIRALRIMGRNELCIKELADSNGILNFVELLQNESGNEIKCCCLQTLLELAKTDTRAIGEQLQEHNGIEVISQLSYSEDKDIAESCINILCTITRHFSVRVSVGTMGGIEAFIYQIQSNGPLLIPSIEGICMCCREAVNRNKIRSCGGLEVLLDILHRPGFSRVFDNILGAFVCFTYDELALKRLLGCGLISTLVSILQKLLFPKKATKVGLEKQDDDLLTATRKQPPTYAQKRNATPMSSGSVSATAPLGSTTRSGGSGKLATIPTPPTPLPDTSYPSSFSPPTCLSPNLSPELRVSYMSPYSPQSVRSSSPVVYSPSGSEADDDSSSESSDGNPEQDSLQEPDVARSDSVPQDPTAPNVDDPRPSTCNDATLSKDIAGSCGEGANSLKDLEATNEDVVGSLIENLAATHSANMETVSKDKRGVDCQPSLNDEGFFPRRPSDQGSEPGRVPLLPGTSFNEHLHLFLPDENLFSADQPSPKKILPRSTESTHRSRRMSCGTPRGVSKGSSGVSKGSFGIANTPDTSPQSPTYSSCLHGVECKIIFLLSRVGQMPDTADSEALTSPECIQTLLDYLCYSKKPDSRCVRLLSRIAWDRKYFETLVIIMLPGAIYRQLVRGLRPSYLLFKQLDSSSGSEFDNSSKESLVFASESPRIVTQTVIPTNKPDEASMTLACEPSTIVERNPSNINSPVHKSTKEIAAFDFNPDVSLNQSAGHEGSGVIERDQVGTQTTCQLPLISKRKEQNASLDTAEENNKDECFSPDRTREIGRSLLSILTTQACSSFGEGILAHLLLRGTQKQKEACALSLPYLCKAMRIKRKLLVNYKGILVILSILCDSTERADKIRAVDSLTYLVSNSSLKMDKSFELFVGRNSAGKPSVSEKNDSQDAALGGAKLELLSGDNRKTDSGSATVTKEESGTDTTSVGNRKLQCSPTGASSDGDMTITITGVCEKTDCMPREEDNTSDRCRKFPAAMNEDDSSSSTAAKRLREVEKIDDITCKRTKVESCSSMPEFGFSNCLYNIRHSTSFDVVVRVDTGESIEAHRSVLCAFSEVFAAMLSSDFAEANQSEILIKDLNHATVLFLVHYAYGCRWSFEPDSEKRPSVCQLFEEHLSSGSSPCLQSDRFKFDFDFLLRLLACADRFLLTGLKNQCEQLMMYSVTGERVADAYLTGACYNTPRLRVYCLQYIFLGDLDLSCVYHCVVNLLESEERYRVIEDFKNIALDCCV